MTYQELVLAITQLPLNERLLLLEAVARSLREELTPPPEKNVTPFESLRGILKPNGPMPTDEELERLRDEYLLEKYA